MLRCCKTYFKETYEKPNTILKAIRDFLIVNVKFKWVTKRTSSNNKHYTFLITMFTKCFTENTTQGDSDVELPQLNK